MNDKKLVKTAMLAGEIMLASGAETYRVEDTITHILKVSGYEIAEGIVTGMAISVTLADGEECMISSVKRVLERETNLGNVYKVNTVCRQFCAGIIALDEVYLTLKEIKNTKTYTEFQRFLANWGTVMFFAITLGGSYFDFAIATINGLLVAIGLYTTRRIQLNSFFRNVLCAALVAISSSFFQFVLHLPITMDVVISGSILPLLPGVAITNAIRDTLQGDYMSGGARAVEAFVMAASIAIGIGCGLALFK